MTSRANKKRQKKLQEGSLPLAVDPSVVLNGFPAEAQKMFQQQFLVKQETIAHVGPLPSPDQLAKYEAQHPGITERIIRLTESEQEHRHKSEQLLLEALSSDASSHRKCERRGDWMAFTVCILCFALGVFFFLKDSTWLAGMCIGAPIVSAASNFIYRKKVNSLVGTQPLPPNTPGKK